MVKPSHEALPSHADTAIGLEDVTLWDTTGEVSDVIHYAAADLSQPECTLRVRDMPEGERPRDRLFHYGSKVLSTAELLAILFGTGQGSPRLSSVGLAQQVLQVLCDGNADVLEQLQHITAEELLNIAGIGPAKAATVLAAIELGNRIFNRGPVQRTVIDDPALAAAALSEQLMWEPREHFAVMCLNIRHQLLSTKILTRGTPTETLADPRDIFSAALRAGAARIIVAHNHPSGNLEPSSEDLRLTRQLLRSANIISVPVLDHLILGGGNYQSLRQTTSLWEEEPQEISTGKTTLANKES